MKAFGVFKGGGVKGLAHVGAYKAATERGIEFEGVAGTSAGSIVAALIAVGYSPDELYKPDGADKGPFGEPYTEFFEEETWARAERCRRNLSHIRLNLNLFFLACHVALYFLLGRALPLAINVLRVLGGVLLGLFAWREYQNLAVSCWFVECVVGYILFFWMFRQQRLASDLHWLVDALTKGYGLFSTKAFTVWLDPLIRKKVTGSGENGAVLFRDISDKIPLKIIASDVTHQTVFVFSQADTPEIPIIDAVAASMSIPVVFQPKACLERIFVDGGVVSNNPAWALDDERARAGIGVPTLMFNLQERSQRLILQPNTLQKPVELFGRFLKQVLMTVFEGGEILQYRQVGNLHIIPISVGVSTLTIDLSEEQRRTLYLDGKNQAREQFEQIAGPQDPQKIKEEVLRPIHDILLDVTGMQGRHLRVAVMIRICKNSSDAPSQRRYLLRVCCSYNMDNDADDQMELDLNVGGAGQCWRERQLIFVDMNAARKTYSTVYGMTKYQQALVRPNLNGLLCIPISAPQQSGISLAC